MRPLFLLPITLLSMLAATPPMPVSAAETANHDESKVPPYQLPEVLTMADGAAVKTAADWNGKRRPEIVRLFEENVYGVSPALPPVSAKVLEKSDTALGGKAKRQQVRVSFSADPAGPGMTVLLYTPADAKGPVPIFWGLNFTGNHSISNDPDILLGGGWVAGKDGEHRALESTRGQNASRWPVEWVLAQGYGLATACYGDIDPDEDDGFKNGVHALCPEIEKKRDGTAWGTVAAWAWGLRAGLNWLETEPSVDAKRVALHGHSRLGKAALWAGATDPRFWVVISNESGCGGAALSMRIFGETVGRINTSFPHWFCANFRKYNGKESALPVDQHMLLALVAPRPLFVGSAEEDLWADPKGEELSQIHATPVYNLLSPQAEKSGLNPRQRYFIRPGKHDVLQSDWEAWVAFANGFRHE